jgi:hypothetical protein
MQGCRVDDRLRLGFRRRAKNPGGAFQELIAPLLDLGRMDIEVLRQLDQGLLALDRRYSDFRLEGRAVVPARSSRHGHLLARGNHAAVARKIHLSRLFSFPEPPLLWIARRTTPVVVALPCNIWPIVRPSIPLMRLHHQNLGSNT